MSRTKLIATIAGGVAMMASTAGAQELRSSIAADTSPSLSNGGCACVVAPTGPSTNIGVVSNAAGNVMATTAQGFQTVAAGQSLPGVSEVMTGPGGSARLSVAQSCQLDLAANQTVRLSMGGSGDICVARSNVYTSQQTGQGVLGFLGGGGGATGQFFVAAGVWGTAAGGTFALGVGSDPASP